MYSKCHVMQYWAHLCNLGVIMFLLMPVSWAEMWMCPQWAALQQQCLFWRLFSQDVKENQTYPTSHCPLSLPTAFSGNPSLSVLHPNSRLAELEGLWMYVEGCSGPTAINSSPARSSLSAWWNLPTAAACHTVQEGLETNASTMCLLFCFACKTRVSTGKEQWDESQATFGIFGVGFHSRCPDETKGYCTHCIIARSNDVWTCCQITLVRLLYVMLLYCIYTLTLSEFVGMQQKKKTNFL